MCAVVPQCDGSHRGTVACIKDTLHGAPAEVLFVVVAAGMCRVSNMIKMILSDLPAAMTRDKEQTKTKPMNTWNVLNPHCRLGVTSM